MKIIRSIACVAITISALPIAAKAQDEPEIQVTSQGFNQARIGITDLNLLSNAGVKQLNERIMIAAGQVCEGVDRNYGIGMPVTWGKCRFATYNAAMPQAEALIARARSGKHVATNIVLRGGKVTH
jgi:UrcA family protein